MTDVAANWFDQGGEGYSRYRPDYPEALARYLRSQAPDGRLAVDVGCGTGQLTQLLARFFDRVTGTDPSADQLAHAAAADGVEYLCAPAENLGLEAGSASLITAAQAAHWFDLPAFYAEARRIAKPGAVLALISYGVPVLDDAALDARFAAFYHEEIGPYWPPERQMVDTGYAGLDFPFEELTPPPLRIERRWNAGEFLGYISTWSAVRRAREAGREDILSRFAAEFLPLWEEEDRERLICWPVAMRIGKIA